MQWNKCALWSLPLTDSISFSACFRISRMVIDGLLEGFIKIMAMKHFSTERETVLNTNVSCYWLYTSLWPRGCLELPRG